MWDLIVSVPDHWLSFYFALTVGHIIVFTHKWLLILINGVIRYVESEF